MVDYFVWMEVSLCRGDEPWGYASCLACKLSIRRERWLKSPLCDTFENFQPIVPMVRSWWLYNGTVADRSIMPV